MSKYSRLRRVAIAGACLLASAAPGWGAAVCVAPVQGGGEPVERLHKLDQKTWLVETRQGLLRFSESGTPLQAFDGPNIHHVTHLVPLGGELALILSDRDASGWGGAFRADKSSLKVQELNGSEALRFTSVARLAAGGAIVGTDRGLYRVDSTGLQLQDVSGADTGRVIALEPIDESAWLVGAAFGAFRIDARASRAERLSGAETGEVTHIQRLADGGWLIGAERGLFRADGAGRALTALPARKPIRVAEFHKLADGGWLVRADQGLVVVDAQARRLDAVDDDNTPNWRIQHSDERGVLLQNRRLLHAMLPGSRKPEFLSGEPVNDVYAVRGIQDGWLIAARRGLFRVELQRRRVAPLRGPALGRVLSLHPLNDGRWLAISDTGLFRTDAALQNVEPVPGPAVGQVLITRPLADGGLLIGAGQGLFRMDAQGKAVTPLAGAPQSGISSLEQLATGSWLAAGRGGIASLDASAETATTVPGGPVERGAVIQPLSDGRALVGTSRGLLATAVMLGDAQATVAVDRPLASGWWQSSLMVTGTLRHACAAVAEDLRLVVEAAADDGADAAVRVPATIVGRTADAASFTADLGTLGSGRWRARLVATATGTDVPVGKPAAIVVDAPAGQWLRANWLWLLAAFAAVQALAFGVLLGLAHWRAWPLRVLRSIWAKVLIWPSLLLPRAWLLQRWTLSPWFRAERAKAAPPKSFVEVPVRGPDGADLPAAALLARLATSRRVWLQGRSGMGKSTACAAWHAAFFGDHSGLLKASRRFGFALLPVPAHALALARRDDDPGKTVLRLAEAAFERSGASCGRGLLRAMLRRGRLALVIDSPNRPVRDALAVFVRACPEARFLVTSDQPGPDAFEAWRLPARLASETVEQLLQLWLGAYSGSRLTAQLDREETLAHLLTCYDVRLVADLVTDDPGQVLPTDRIKLFRAVFARAKAHNSKLQDLGPLKALAWTMTLEGRSEIKADELAWLEGSSREILLAPGSRVLRELEPGVFTFDHEQLRFLLAAEHLVDTNQGVGALIGALENSPVWDCERGDQEELWRFLAAVLAPEDVTALWRFSLDDPVRVFLQYALHKHGLETKIFPLGMVAALSNRDDAAPVSRLRTVEV
jgi:hypothetical protein